MIAIVDYGVGNLRSVQKAFEAVGADAHVTQDINTLNKAEKIVLPGVGAIGAAMDKLSKLNLIDTLKASIDQQKAFLGICVGFQLLFERSEEGGAQGLGFLEGEVKRFTSLKVPHMGWNALNIHNESKLFKGTNDQSYVYFCHSYFVEPNNNQINAATTDYGISFSAAIEKDNIYGVQFHPEKSQEVGLNILKNFSEV